MKKFFAMLLSIFAVCLTFVFLNACGGESGKYFTVEYSATDGGVVEGVLTQSITAGKVGSQVIAVANEGYVFFGWSDGEENAQRVDSPKENLSISAIFKKIYSVNFKGAYGDVILYKQEYEKVEGAKITFVAKDVLGYSFVNFSDGTANLSVEYTVDSDINITANYTIDALEMPVFYVVTENLQGVDSKETYISSSITVLNTEEEYCLNGVSAGIRGRGNSTWGQPKNPYRIKFDKKTEMFGCGYKQKSWVLLANYFDKSLSRNLIAYELGSLFDGIDFSSMHIPVELYLNGEYCGVYLLCDQIQTGKGRVDIQEDFYEDGDVGYFLELDMRAATEGEENKDWFRIKDEWFGDNFYTIKTPDTEEDGYNADLHVGYIKNYLLQCINALYGNDFEKVKEFIDVDSFIDTYIIQELFANNDVGFSSFYLYKDKGGKLFAGPVWDFDIAGGNCNYNMGNEKECPYNECLWAATTNSWYKALMNYEEFRQAVKQKLTDTYKERIFNVIALLDSSNKNGLYQKYKNAYERNFKKHQIMGINISPNPESVTKILTVSGQIEYLHDWLLARYYYVVDAI